ncbi:hypothetical protein L6386_03575 [bacterium]|nr:hypothetical protein [bacterium]MCG2677623.1 hypothetical protein [bacterium]
MGEEIRGSGVRVSFGDLNGGGRKWEGEELVLNFLTGKTGEPANWLIEAERRPRP